MKIHSREKLRKAFTLIELLVVIGLIAVLAGGIGLAFGGGDKANALQGAQATLQSMASAVRGQAALSGENAALFINVNDATDTENYLRSFVVAIKDGSKWVVVGDDIILPAGIYLVPGNADGSIAKTLGVTEGSKQILHYRYTNPDTTSPDTYLYEPYNHSASYTLVIELNSRGSKVSTGATSQIVLSPAERSPDGITFISPELVRGAIISNYGVLTPINDASGF